MTRSRRRQDPLTRRRGDGIPYTGGLSLSTKYQAWNFHWEQDTYLRKQAEITTFESEILYLTLKFDADCRNYTTKISVMCWNANLLIFASANNFSKSNRCAKASNRSLLAFGNSSWRCSLNLTFNTKSMRNFSLKIIQFLQNRIDFALVCVLQS
jgi:hypothetical protein